MDANFALVPLIGMMSSRPLLAALIGMLVWLLNNRNHIQPYIDMLARTVRIPNWFLHRELLLEGRISYHRSSIFCHMTDEMKGILRYMQSNLDSIGTVRYVEAIDVASTSDSDRRTVNIPMRRNTKVDLCNGFMVEVYKIKDDTVTDKYYGDSVDVTYIYVRLISVRLGYNHMDDFLLKCAAEYRAHITAKSDTQMIYEYMCNDDNDNPVFSSGPFVSSKTFDNLFFEGKDEIIKRITNFESQAGRARSEKLGMQHAMGMLFYGLPGCGKTSGIKAIANLTKRHVVIVRMDRIFHHSSGKCVDVLKGIMHAPKIGDLVVPQKQRLWVFQEIDCWHNIIQERATCSSIKKRKDKQDQDAASTLIDMLQMSVQPDPACADHKQSASQLGGLLELLGGMMEMPDRMIIMTTNHPEKLDAALIRPGRIDIRHEFKQLSRMDLDEVYCMWYGQRIPEQVLQRMPDYQFTQAELAQIL